MKILPNKYTADGSAPYMRSLLAVTVFALLGLSLTSCASDEAAEGTETAMEETSTAPNTLTQQEMDEGWTLLFDGQEVEEHWIGLGRDQIPEGHWEVEDGTIRKVASGDVPTAPDGQPLEGGDIMTKETFSDFEFSFEWRVSEAGNSGIKYNVSEELSTSHEPDNAALGFEYQVLDDERHPDGEDPTHRVGSLYDMIAAPESKTVNPVGEWNHSRIVFDGMHGEHWLNGEKVVEYDMDSARFDSLLAASKYADIEGFATRRDGHVVLQDHSDDVWYRNLKIRSLSQEQAMNE